MTDPFGHLPQARFEGAIHIIESTDQIAPFMETLLAEDILGFDTETRPAFRRGEHYRPALIQIACSRSAYIFRLRALGGIPELLMPVITRAQPVIAGIGLSQDMTALREWGPLTLQDGALLDLVPLAQKLGHTRPNLRALAAKLLGLRVSKKARLSNWDAITLTPAQIQYAATDAWISRELAINLLDEKKNAPSASASSKHASPPPPARKHPEKSPSLAPGRKRKEAP